MSEKSRTNLQSLTVVINEKSKQTSPNLLKLNSVTYFFHKNLPCELPTTIQINLRVFCGRTNKDFAISYRQNNSKIVQQLCFVLNLRQTRTRKWIDENERTYTRIFPPSMVEVSRVDKESTSVKVSCVVNIKLGFIDCFFVIWWY